MRLSGIGWVLAAAGCGGDARVDMTAADTLDALAVQMERALTEYHAELEAADDAREEAVVDAFISRVKTDVSNDEKLDSHSRAFGGAMKRIRSDRAVEWQRHTAAADNINLMREVGDGLRKLAVQSLLVQDEVKRYVTSLMDAKRRAQAATGETP
jgi:hypothetical protein